VAYCSKRLFLCCSGRLDIARSRLQDQLDAVADIVAPADEEEDEEADIDDEEEDSDQD
jgi:hypothetical protein